MTVGGGRSLVGRSIRYGIAGLGASAIYFGAVVALVEGVRLSPVVSAVLATMIVILSSYVVNRTFVFDTDRAHASAFTRFVIASLVGIALNAGLMHLATRVFSWPYLVGAALTVVVVPPLNFAMNYLWAFRATDV